MDSPDRASNDQSILEGAPNEDSAPQEEGILVGGPSVNEIGEGSPSAITHAPLLLLKPANIVPSRRRPPNQVLLSTYVPPHERIAPSANMVAPNLEGARVIIHRWSPFNRAKRPVVHMRNLYPNYFRVPVAAQQNSIPLCSLPNLVRRLSNRWPRMGCSSANHYCCRSTEWYVMLYLVDIFALQFHCSFSFIDYDNHPEHGSPAYGISVLARQC